MKNARIMDRPEDFEKLGISPNKVELWEEGRRNPAKAGNNEVWYFDGTLTDGSKFIIGFRPKAPAKTNLDGDSPNINMVITTPDGREVSDFQYFTAEESYTGKGEGCDLKYGPNTAKGDFKHYDLHIEAINGIGADLQFKALVEPFRQGTGIVTFGDNDEFHHTDLAVPKNCVTGILYYDGKEHQVEGLGYHDHQWMNTIPMVLYHHWLWGRMYTDKYTVYIYDFVTAEAYGFKRLPMFGLLDNETGKIVFKTDGHFTLETKKEMQPQLGREFPKVSRYVFENSDGQSVEFTITWEQELETRDMYGKAPETIKKQYDSQNIAPTYMRYYAKGTVAFKDPLTETSNVSSGDMIYEYAYFGRPDERSHI